MAGYDEANVAEAIRYRAMDPEGPKRLLWERFFRPLVAGSASHGRTLDFGAGTAWLPYFAALEGFVVDAYDPSQAMCSLARQVSESLPAARFEVFETLAGEHEGRYLLVLANWVIPALETRDDLRRCLADARRALAPGGRLVSTMNHPDFIDRPHRHYRALVEGVPAAGESHRTRLLDGRGGEVLVTRDVYWPTKALLQCALAERLALTEIRDLYDPVDPAGDGEVLERVPAYRALVFERLEPPATGEQQWNG